MKANNSKFKAGMFLLETLTAGMYNDSLSIYREYIQNAIDSFDLVRRSGRRGPQLVKIEIDPYEKSVCISDNGVGIPHNVSEKVLSSIGVSDKRIQKLRGFRGIGRLGGLAFCDTAIFKTKAMGEEVETVQRWDCKKLRHLLSDIDMGEMSLRELFDKTTTFQSNNGLKKAGSYFKVELHDVSSFRNHILDIQKIEKYLQNVAPISFNLDQFAEANEIQAYLKKNVPDYGELSIKLNGEKLYKPYKSYVETTNKKIDPIKEIEFVKIYSGDEIVAHGWYAKRAELLGAIRASEGISGLRVRDGNIAIGDYRLLENCFREARFNSYVFGEIHVVSPELIPNSRRDDFIDNRTKTLFYNDIERKIGLPLSKEIRLKSRLKAQGITPMSLKSNNKNSKLPKPDSPTNHPKSNNLDKLSVAPVTSDQILDEIFIKCAECPTIKIIKKKYGLK